MGSKPLSRLAEPASIEYLKRVKVNRRDFLRRAAFGAAGAGLAAVGGAAYGTLLEPHWFQLVPVTLALPRLPAAFNGFRVAQISDIHLSESLTGQQLADVVEIILAQAPDLVTITGDYVDKTSGLHDSLSTLIDIFRPLAQQIPVVSVLGNHDYWVGAEIVRRVLRESGIKELDNKVLPVERDGARLYVAGVDDVWEGRARLSQVLKQIPNDGQAAILLAHEPDFADSTVMTERFDLQLSGHSHGGQVVLPFYGPPILPHYGRKYPSGQYQVGKLIQYTNRGLGTIPPRVRLNCRPEITLFTLNPAF